MVIASAANRVQMQIAFCASDKALPKIFNAVRLKARFFSVIAERHEGYARNFSVEDEVGTSSEIDCSARKRFVHRIDKKSRTRDTGAVAERFCETASEHDTRIFDEVMLIDVQIA